MYKSKPYEVNKGPQNTVILKFLKLNMNMQFVTNVYAMLTYLTYLSNSEHTNEQIYEKAIKGGLW